MMAGKKQYYTLVASLREYSTAGGEKGFDSRKVYGEIRRELGRDDRRAAGLLWSLTDIYGLGRDRVEQLYALCAASDCAWLRRWARFDRNLRNIVAAHTARAKGLPVADALLNTPGDEVALSLSRSSAADFNLKGELDYVNRLLAALDDEANAVEKERTIDLIRWEMADSLAEGDWFGISAILAWLVKAASTGRWSALDPATGREMYVKLLASIDAARFTDRTPAVATGGERAAREK